MFIVLKITVTICKLSCNCCSNLIFIFFYIRMVTLKILIVLALLVLWMRTVARCQLFSSMVLQISLQ